MPTTRDTLVELTLPSHVYMISYDLHRGSEDDYKELWEAIEGYTESHTLESFWLIKTWKTTQQVFDDLKVHIDAEDKLIVIQCVKGARYTNNLEVEDLTFLLSNL